MSPIHGEFDTFRIFDLEWIRKYQFVSLDHVIDMAMALLFLLKQ